MTTTHFLRIPCGGDRTMAADLHVPSTIPEAIGAVLIVHGFKGFKDWGFFPFVGNALADRGLFAMRVNLSGCGIRDTGETFDDPDGFEQNTYSQELRDIHAAFDALEERVRDLAGGTADLPLGLLGHSRGGGMAMVFTVEDPRVRCLVTWAAIAREDRFGPDAIRAWDRGETHPIVNARTGQTFRLRRDWWDDLERNRARFDLLRRAAELAVPWLVLHGEEDESVPVEEAEALFAAALGGSHPELARLRKIPGAGHTFGAVHPFQGAPEALKNATEETSAWFVEHFRADLDTRLDSRFDSRLDSHADSGPASGIDGRLDRPSEGPIA